MKRKLLSYKILLILSLLALAVLLVPLVALGTYAVPAADDFSYGAAAHRAFVEGGFPAALRAALGQVAETYMNWQGTFSAVFLMAIQPAIFSEGLYWLTPVIMLAALLGGTFLFCGTVLPGVFGLRRDVSAIIAAVLSILCTQLIPSPVQGLYWFNGSVYYVFFHGLMLAAMALAVKCLLRGGTWRQSLLCLLCLILGGGNYVTALSCAIILVSVLLLLGLMKDKRAKRLILPTLFLLAAFVVNMAAPGNAVRQAASEGTSAVTAVLLSFRYGLSYAVGWFSLPLLGALIFLAPLIWHCVKASGFSFSFPGLFSLYSYCLFSAMFCPPVYAMGNVGDKRLLNMVYFAHVLLLTLNLIYWLGWAARRFARPADTKNGLPLSTALISVVLMFSLLAAGVLFGTGLSSVGAVSTLLSGEAGAYHDHAMRRFELLNDSSLSHVVLEDFPVKPYMLYFDDIQPDTGDWRNVDMATFYGKDSVALAQP